MGTLVKLTIGICAFVVLEVLYTFTYMRDTERQLSVGAVFDQDGRWMALSVVMRNDNMARGIVLSYILFVSSLFTYLRSATSSPYSILSLAGTIIGLALMTLIFVLRDHIGAWEFGRKLHWGKLFLVVARIVAYLFILAFLL